MESSRLSVRIRFARTMHTAPVISPVPDDSSTRGYKYTMVVDYITLPVRVRNAYKNIRSMFMQQDHSNRAPRQQALEVTLHITLC